jgi:hypothetical protein
LVIGAENSEVFFRKKKDKRSWKGRKSIKTADGNKDGGLRRMDDTRGWSK